MKAHTAARALRREERKKALSLDAPAQATPTHQSQEPPQPSPQASAPEPQEDTADAAGSGRGNPSQPSFERLAPTKPEPRAAPCPATPDSGQGGRKPNADTPGTTRMMRNPPPADDGEYKLNVQGRPVRPSNGVDKGRIMSVTSMHMTTDGTLVEIPVDLDSCSDGSHIAAAHFTAAPRTYNEVGSRHCEGSSGVITENGPAGHTNIVSKGYVITIPGRRKGAHWDSMADASHTLLSSADTYLLGADLGAMHGSSLTSTGPTPLRLRGGVIQNLDQQRRNGERLRVEFWDPYLTKNRGDEPGGWVNGHTATYYPELDDRPLDNDPMLADG